MGTKISLRQWFKAFNVSEVSKSARNRRLQAELDTHKALLLTEAYRELQQGTELDADAAERITQLVDAMNHEERVDKLQGHLRRQLMDVTAQVHNALHQLGDAAAGQPVQVLQQAMQQDWQPQQVPAGTTKAAMQPSTGKAEPQDPVRPITDVSVTASSGSADSLSWTPHAKAIATAGNTAPLPQARVQGRVRGLPLPAASTPQTAAAGSGDALSNGGGATWQEVAEHYQAAAGFRLEVAPSGIAHPAAGNGVWIRGKAFPGQLVSLYPGLVYPKDMHRHLPDYPRVDRNNVYLISRYDMHVLDAKPWAHGKGAPIVGALTLGYLGEKGAQLRRQEALGEQQDGQTDGHASPQQWPVLPVDAAEAQVQQWQQMAQTCEGRHPLALGHIINHPPPGKHPNVMLVPFDLQLPIGALPLWRRYVPNMTFVDLKAVRKAALEAEEDARAEQLWQQASGWPMPAATSADGKAQPALWRSLLQRVGLAKGQDAALPQAQTATTVRGVALVATRLVQQEELFLNYRLSPHIPRPSWYAAVSNDEEQRRWG